MEGTVSTPWHRASFDRFLNESLPALLTERLPLAGYRVAHVGATACRVTVSVVSDGEDVRVHYEALPYPDDEGIFWLAGGPKVVVPLASEHDLSLAEIRCVGEQLLAFVEARLGGASPGMVWTEDLLRAWLPLEAWVGQFLAGTGGRLTPVQLLDDRNWLARHTHLRRLIIAERDDVIHPSHAGRVCPFETPEGDNLGHVLTIATGAAVRDGKLVIVDDRPEAGLGLSASAMPFLEHNDPNRNLMGANMLRQWVVQSQPEPALVQTGLEPDAPGFWNGRNLLTAFVSWGEGTYDDGIVVSASCARRFETPYPLQIGDKLSDRHGNKGVVSRILPDAQMPSLQDGTPVDLIVSFANFHRRAAFGVIREAVVGRIAAAEGAPAIVPPYGAPGELELFRRLEAAGLPTSGQVQLRAGLGGRLLDQPSTVGYVYWGGLIHLAKDKLHTFVGGRWGQLQGGMECAALLQAGALENLREAINTASIRGEDNETLAARVAAGPIEPASEPTPLFADLVRRLRIGGIIAEVDDAGLRVSFGRPGDDALRLAQPMAHPWMRERELTEVGAPADLVPTSLPMGGSNAAAPDPQAAYERVLELNHRLVRLQEGQVPERLRDGAAERLAAAVQTYIDAVLQPIHLSLRDRRDFTGRAVIVPGDGLAVNQVGLPEEMAWALFGPQVVRSLGGDSDAVARREGRAMEALEGNMAASWVLINRAPTWTPSAIVALHPVRVRGDAIQLPPLVAGLLNADFDGDQVAVILPLTETAQREAGEKLSVAGHLRRDPGLLSELVPRRSALWGLAYLSQQPEGLAALSSLLGAELSISRGAITGADLEKALQDTLAREGVEAVLVRLERLARRGFQVARDSGASLAPFVDATALLPPQPSGEGTSAWETYLAEVHEVLASPVDCASASLVPQCLMARAEAAGAMAGGLRISPFVWLIAGRGPVVDAAGETVVIANSHVKGLTADEMAAAVVGARRGLAQLRQDWQRMGQELAEQTAPRGFSVLARARRSDHPGIVFARAAATGEVDPLTDMESRLLVGLNPAGPQAKVR